ncbi:MAG: hypothetical protein FWE95_03300 [Planctomycetaceae bacterium]|nr:hypothetical protein [Planctomycetaceae bacterium]
MSDTVLLNMGIKTLINTFGVVDAERFVYLVNKGHGDYTEFRHTLFEGMSLDDICREAAQAKIEADARMANNE